MAKKSTRATEDEKKVKKFYVASEDEAMEPEEGEEAGDDLSNMNRSELKKMIAKLGLPIKVKTSMTDDQIREAIAQATEEPKPVQKKAKKHEEEEEDEGESPTEAKRELQMKICRIVWKNATEKSTSEIKEMVVAKFGEDINIRFVGSAVRWAKRFIVLCE